eukprot:2106893-Prymnesium_polylepis.1
MARSASAGFVARSAHITHTHGAAPADAAKGITDVEVAPCKTQKSEGAPVNATRTAPRKLGRQSWYSPLGSLPCCSLDGSVRTRLHPTAPVLTPDAASPRALDGRRTRSRRPSAASGGIQSTFLTIARGVWSRCCTL